MKQESVYGLFSKKVAVVERWPLVEVAHFFCRLLRFDDNEPGRQLKQPPAAFLEADSAEVRFKLPFSIFCFRSCTVPVLNCTSNFLMCYLAK